MKQFCLAIVREEDGILTAEWILFFTLMVIGLVSGLAAMRDSLIDELADGAEAMIALDQSYNIDAPLMPYVIDPALNMGPDLGGGTDMSFSDTAVSHDCDRFGVPGQFAELDDDPG